MHILQAAALSVIEGLTEFLPISSTGHLIVASRLLHVTDSNFSKSFDICIQLGAILAVAILYSKRLYNFKQWAPKTLVAFFPTALVGLLVYPLLKKYLLGNFTVVVLALVIGGFVILLFESWYKKKNLASFVRFAQISYRSAFIIGCCQTLAIVPGVSRSAATIIGALVLGIARSDALEFSFLLAIPTMAAATGLDILKSGHSFSPSEWQLLAVGFVGSFVTAFISVRWLTSYVAKHSFAVFGWYRIVVAAVFALLFWL